MTSLIILQVPHSLGGELAGEDRKKRELSEEVWGETTVVCNEELAWRHGADKH